MNCVYASAQSRQTATFESSCILDVITDALLISIPVLLLWNARLLVRQKFALCGILCLSILMIVIAIIRVVWGKASNGQVDSSWANLWLQVEASVGVIVVSISAFRALFVAQKTSKYERKIYREDYVHPLKNREAPKALRQWPREWTLLGAPRTKISTDVKEGVLNIPSPINRVDTHIRRGSSAMSFDDDANGMHWPLQVHVRRDISRFENVGPSLP